MQRAWRRPVTGWRSWAARSCKGSRQSSLALWCRRAAKPRVAVACAGATRTDMVHWIKICGMTTPEAVDAALEAGVDAIGFVFAASRRRITPHRAAQLAAVARGRLQCVAVMRHPQQQALDEVLEAFQPDVLQSDAEDFAALHLPATLQT